VSSPLAPVEERMLALYFARRPFSAAQLGGGLWDGGLPPVGPDRAADLIAGLRDVRRDLAPWQTVDVAGDIASDPTSRPTAGPLPASPGTDRAGGGARRGAPTGGSAAESVVTARLMHEIAGYEIAALRAGWDRFTVSPLPEAGLASALLTFLPYASVAGEHDASLFAHACGEIAATLDASNRELAAGRADGQLPVARLVRRSVAQIDAYLAGPAPTCPPDGPPIAAASRSGDRYVAAVAAMPKSLRERIRALVADHVRPAFARYRDELAGPVLASARDDEHPGLAFVPGGEQIYADAIRGHTTLPITADQAHRIGLDQVQRWRAEAESIADNLGWDTGFDAVRDRMRTDPALFFASGEEIERAAEAALRRAERAAPTWIGPLPESTCEVLAMDPVESPHGVLGHYETAPLDRHRPARYWVNVADPSSRPRYEAQALAYHESVPGHHLEIARSQERPSPSRFRQVVEILPYTEGWGLYAEGLADEMGLYSGPVDRLGMVSFALWRACRLVVDTGLHAAGWSRHRAVDYLWHNTMLTRANVENEVDRYIAHPGSALGYLLGRLTIEKVKASLVTDRTDPAQQRAFHGRLLDGGPMTMTLLTECLSGSAAPR
jgi:uncharacterized protein (DUF885 family)